MIIVNNSTNNLVAFVTNNDNGQQVDCAFLPPRQRATMTMAAGPQYKVAFVVNTTPTADISTLADYDDTVTLALTVTPPSGEMAAESDSEAAAGA